MGERYSERRGTCADRLELSEIDPKPISLSVWYLLCIALWYSQYNLTSREYDNTQRSKRLREASFFLADKIIERGFNAYSLAHERRNEDYRTRLPFKTLATRSGLGWIGKSACLVTKEYGNAIRLNGVLTDMPLAVGTPVNESFCGKCEECVRHCPGHAVKGNLWSLHMDRDDLLDAFGCKKAVVERGKVFNVTDGTCGICISVCPWTKRYISRRISDS